MLLAQVACFRPDSTGLACDDRLPCPGGQVCRFGTCAPGEDGATAADAARIDAASVDATMTDGPPGDVDGDGVSNLLDNCPTLGNSDQHDEDADGRGDRCDGCPFVEDDGADLDGDGVGNACDPGAGVHQVRYFDPFVTERPEWTTVDATVAGDLMRFDLLGQIGVAELSVPTDQVELWASGRLRSIGTTGEQKLALWFGRDEDNEFRICEFYRSGVFSTVAMGISGVTVFDGENAALVPGDFRIRVRISPGQLRCDLTLGTEGHVLSAGQSTPASTGVGLQVFDLGVDVSSFAIVGLAP